LETCDSCVDTTLRRSGADASRGDVRDVIDRAATSRANSEQHSQSLSSVDDFRAGFHGRGDGDSDGHSDDGDDGEDSHGDVEVVVVVDTLINRTAHRFVMEAFTQQLALVESTVESSSTQEQGEGSQDVQVATLDVQVVLEGFTTLIVQAANHTSRASDFVVGGCHRSISR